MNTFFSFKKKKKEDSQIGLFFGLSLSNTLVERDHKLT